MLQGSSPPQAADLQHQKLRAADLAGPAGRQAQLLAGHKIVQELLANPSLADLRIAKQEVVHQAIASPSLVSPHLVKQEVVQQITADQSLAGPHPARVDQGRLARLPDPQVGHRLIRDLENQLVVAQAKRRV